MRGKTGAVVAVALILVTGAFAATTASKGKAKHKPSVTLTTLYNFTGSSDGGYPIERVLNLKSGNLFGVTGSGGANFYGAVYELVNSGGTYTQQVIYSFTGTGGDGCYPYSELLMDKSGNLFGTTNSCGSSGYGTVFELMNSGGSYTETVLHSFSYSDGAYPYGALAMDKSGNLFGSTSGGGTSGYGTVWELSGGTLTTLASLDYSTMGGYPYGGVNMDPSGNLWGTACCGGANSDGVVFELTNSGGNWTYNTVHAFNYTDGASPYYGRVTIGKGGNIYGTACCGGTSGYGVVWFLKNSGGTWTESTLYNFTNSGGDGGYPYGGLGFSRKGHLYGTTYYGGTNSYGTAFELIHGSSGWTETVLYDFAYSDGGYPFAGANADKKGNFFGVTDIGGTGGAGTVFMITGAP